MSRAGLLHPPGAHSPRRKASRAHACGIREDATTLAPRTLPRLSPSGDSAPAVSLRRRLRKASHSQLASPRLECRGAWRKGDAMRVIATIAATLLLALGSLP